MSHTYASTLVHCVFSTKQRAPFIGIDLQPRLWAYMGGVARTHGFTAVAIGGIDDHAHALLHVPPRIAVSEAVKKMKAASSKWVHDQGRERKSYAWQEGYGAFSVSISHAESTVAYIRNQQEHHRKRDFQQEFIAFLRKHVINYDPARVWG